MTRIKVKGFQIFPDRHGKMRCYHRKTRTAVNLKTAPLGSAEFFAECARISELTKLAGIPKPGTFGLLIAEYKTSDAFLDDLAPRTQADYQRCLNYLKPIADTPLHRFDRALVVRIRDKARRPLYPGIVHLMRHDNSVFILIAYFHRSMLFSQGMVRV